MARRRFFRRTGRPAGVTSGLVVFLLLCVAVLAVVAFYRQKDSLMVLSNKTIYACDTLLKDLGYDTESSEVTVQQVNYDRNRPYTYLYRRLVATNAREGMRDLKKGFQRVLPGLDPFRRIRILKYAEVKEDSRVLWSFKLGVSGLVFYSLEFVGSGRETANRTNTAGEEYAGFDGEEGFGEFGTPTQKTQSGRKPAVKVRARIAVIVDDVGSEPERLTRKFLSFPGRLTFAVFPGLPVTSDRDGRISDISRFEVIVHQPMEPEDRKEMVKSLMASEIYKGMSAEQIAKVLTASLESVRHAKGVNNHQGSLASSDLKTMEAVVRRLKQLGLYFVDSYTVASSVGYKAAAAAGIPYQKRDIFLDNENSRDYVQKQLDKLVALGIKRGSAVGIGHMNREATIDVLLANYRRLRDQGVEFVLVRDLLIRP